MGDHVDEILAGWHREIPALDTEPMAVLGRVERLARLVQNDLAPLFASHGISGGEFDVLAALRRAGPAARLSPSALSDALMVTSGGMTKRLKRLEQAGLVRRVPSADDRRSLLVTSTPAGRDLVDAVVARHVARERRLLGGLDRPKRRRLARLLSELLVQLEDESR